jgi:hypothetical protein
VKEDKTAEEEPSHHAAGHPGFHRLSGDAGGSPMSKSMINDETGFGGSGTAAAPDSLRFDFSGRLSGLRDRHRGPKRFFPR